MKSLPVPAMVKRILVSLVIGLAFGAVLSEVGFVLLKETARAPKTITLTIPEGTADQVARGEQPPTIPTDLVFVVGDTLLVNNQDNTDHKLGPLWIPAHSSAQLSLGQAQNISVECSFQPTKYIGLDVQQSLTWGTRLFGILFAGLPPAILIALYGSILSSQKKGHVPA